ncbi:MAG: DUF262 domain-containing protein, partial [Clostridiales bacterium]|nr:DUF262 domain-containing protein [Clostridiales bacterium]
GDTVRFKYRPFTGSTADCKPEILVLDGQQRLTSIYGAMFCKNAVPTKTDKNKGINRFYYLDIKECLSSTTDRIDAVLSLPEDRIIRENFGRDIVLDLSSREKEFTHHMFPLNIVYDRTATSKWRNEYQKFHGYDAFVVERFDVFDTEILQAIYGYKVPVITLGKDTPKEAVCQVFENVNTGGVSLTVFELVTAAFAAENFELRKDWDVRHDKFVQKADLLSDVSSTDFLTAITLLSRYYVRKAGGEAVSCKKKDVLAITLPEYQKYADSLTDGFIKAANFLKEQRIFTARDLPYTTQLIPLSVLLTILDTRANDSTVKNKISRWVWCGGFGEMYGGANETRYANDVIGVTEWVDGGAEPDTVVRAYFQPTRLLSLQTRLSAAYKGVMALILKAGAVDFISGTDMGFTNFTEQAVDIHHIFPKAYCENKYKREQWNSIVNKTPLSAYTNRILGGSAPSHYLKKIESEGLVTPADLDGFIATHHVDVADLRADNFEDYFVKRAKSLLELISKAMGKGLPNLGSEEVVTTFGASLE